MHLLFTCLLFISFTKWCYSFGCLNNGRTFDWFIVYKLPLLEESKVDNIKNGVGQLYMDNTSTSWSYLEESIGSKGHPLYQTLQQIYTNKNNNSFVSLMYNDEEPSTNFTKTTSGHTKGVIGSDKQRGFWIIHSVPKFPPIKSYKYPKSGTIYGQTILCVTYNYNQLNLIGKQLRFNWPNVYQQNFPQQFALDNPDIVKLLNRQKLGMTAPFSNIINIQFSSGKSFTSFAKSAKFNDDLYSGLVAPKLESTIDVESWINGAAMDLPSNCSTKYHVQNIKTLSLLDNQFDSSKDHSKWAVSTPDSSKSPQNYWICIGDINRQTSQMERGGGIACLDDARPWKQFFSTLVDVETCEKTSPFQIL